MPALFLGNFDDTGVCYIHGYLIIIIGEHPDGPSKVLVTLCLVLLATGMKEAGQSGHAEGQVPVLGKELVQVVSPQGPGFDLAILHLDSIAERLVSFLKPDSKEIIG